jgi:hypothetical protein
MVLQYEHGFLIRLFTFIYLAFFGANVSRVGIVVVDIIQPNVFCHQVANNWTPSQF